MKRFLAIAGLLVVVVAALWTARGREDGSGGASARKERAHTSLRWTSRAPGANTGEPLPRSERAVAIEGRVVDAIARTPIPGADVVLRDDGGGEVDATTTDEDGRFAFEDAGIATVVSAVAPGFGVEARRLATAAREIVLELDGAVRVAGRVLDPDGRGVGGAEVWVEDAERARLHPPSVSSTVRSDPEGRFVVEDAPAGTLVVHAEKDGFAPGETALGGVGPGRDKADVEVALGRAAILAGRIVDEAGEPVAGAEVRWQVWGPRFLKGPGKPHPTDAEGRFRMWVAPGKGVVLASTPTADGTTQVEATADRESSVEVVLREKLRVRGRVVDESDAPVSRAAVFTALDPDARAETDEAGRFELEIARTRIDEKDEIGVSASADGHRGYAPLLAEGREMQIRLERQPIVRYRLVEHDGTPFRGRARVVARDADGGRRIHAREHDATNGEGRIVVAPGTWTIRADWVEARSGSASATIVLEDEATVTLRVDPPDAHGHVTGTVVGADGRAIPGARVSPLRPTREWEDSGGALGGALDWTRSVRSDAAGRFAIGLPKGPQRLFVYHPEFRSEVASVVAPEDGERDAGTIRLEPGNGASSLFEFSGIGAVLAAADDGRCLIRSVIAGGPAERAGLRTDDEILEIDGAPLHGMTLGDAVERIRGPVGTSVRLRVARPGNLEPFTIDVVREKIRA